jgi:adenine specific DNA methylase Mod
MAENTLYFGDNLDILRHYIADESIDLIYLDPPFNSNQAYNVIFSEEDGAGSGAQIEAFDDTWHWTHAAEDTLRQIELTATPHVVDMMQAIVSFVGRNDMTAYLVMMTVRLIELHRVLKPTGSLYLHCDPTASHYLKVVMDTIFGPENFLNEVVWKRTSAHSSANRYGPIHDNVLFYSRGPDHVWNKIYTQYGEEYVDRFYRHIDQDGRRFRLSDITGSGIRHGETGEAWRGVDVTSRGRHWMVPPSEL